MVTQRKIGELLAPFVRPGKVPKKDYLAKGRYPIIDQGKDYIAGYTNDSEVVVFNNLPVTIFGDHTRCVKVSYEPFAAGADGTQLLVPRSEVDPVYFYYSVKNAEVSDYKYERHFKYLREIEITLLPEGQQKAVGQFMRTLDDKIELNRRMNRTLEAMAQAIFKSWFVDFEPIKAKAAAIAAGAPPESIQRAAIAAIAGKTEAELDQLPEPQQQSLAKTAALFPDYFQGSELGEIPQGWSIESAETIVTRLKAGKKFTKKNVLPEGIVPVFDQGAGLLLGFHDGDPDIDASQRCPRFIFGDHTCITHISLKPFSVGPNVIPLEAKIRDPYWTFFAIKDLQEFQEYRRHWMEFKIKNVCVPDSVIATRFGELLKGFYAQVEANTEQSRILAELRDTLLPELLSGELLVPEDEPKTEEINT